MGKKRSNRVVVPSSNKERVPTAQTFITCLGVGTKQNGKDEEPIQTRGTYWFLHAGNGKAPLRQNPPTNNQRKHNHHEESFRRSLDGTCLDAEANGSKEQCMLPNGFAAYDKFTLKNFGLAKTISKAFQCYLLHNWIWRTFIHVFLLRSCLNSWKPHELSSSFFIPKEGEKKKLLKLLRRVQDNHQCCAHRIPKKNLRNSQSLTEAPLSHFSYMTFSFPFFLSPWLQKHIETTDTFTYTEKPMNSQEQEN